MEASSYPLQRKWSIWEQWNLGPDQSFFTNNQGKVGEFDNLHEFWQHWNYLPHGSPVMLFENPESRVKVIIESINHSIEAVCLFESGFELSPDATSNKSGSVFYFEIDSFEFNKTKDVWDRLVFSLIGETFLCSEEMNGCRVVDLKKSCRFEIWAKFDATAARNTSKSVNVKESIKTLAGVCDVNVESQSGY
jgi:hypothetical protein